jgi:hypothetical protein
MTHRTRFSLAAALLVAPLLASTAAAQGAEQVVFSTPGAPMTLTGNTKATTTPFGFWLWCFAEAPATSQGGYGAANVCQGSMYFYALDHNATHVVGFIEETDDGIYKMTLFEGTPAQLFAGNLHPSYTCTLTNQEPDTKGPGHAVVADCLFANSLGGGTGHAVVTNTVVNVTGKP